MRKAVLLNAVTALTTGDENAFPSAMTGLIFIKTSGTVNLTVQIQAKSPLGDWHTIHTAVLTTAANQDPLALTYSVNHLRAVVSAYTSGTVSVSASLRE